METILKTLNLFYEMRHLKVTNEEKYRKAILEYTNLYHNKLDKVSLSSANEEEQKLIKERQKKLYENG